MNNDAGHGVIRLVNKHPLIILEPVDYSRHIEFYMFAWRAEGDAGHPQVAKQFFQLCLALAGWKCVGVYVSRTLIALVPKKVHDHSQPLGAVHLQSWFLETDIFRQVTLGGDRSTACLIVSVELASLFSKGEIELVDSSGDLEQRQPPALPCICLLKGRLVQLVQLGRTLHRHSDRLSIAR